MTLMVACQTTVPITHRARDGENQELERPRGDDATALTQPVNKIWQLAVWNRRMVLHILHTCPGWQDLREISAPFRRILS